MFDIITDSACDLTPEMARQLKLTVVPFYVSTDGEHYLKEGQEIAVRDFYQFMVDHPETLPKTACPRWRTMSGSFGEKAAAGREALCLCFTGKMSGGVGSARNARELVLEEYPDAVIEVVDTAAATVSEGATVLNAAAMRDAGCTLAETLTWLEGTRPTNQIFFTVGNLDYLIKGGRIGKVTALRPTPQRQAMIHFAEGEIFSGGMARGARRAWKRPSTSCWATWPSARPTPTITASSQVTATTPTRAALLMQLRAALRAKYPPAPATRAFADRATIAVHTGPYALGVGVMRKWKPKS